MKRRRQPERAARDTFKEAIAPYVVEPAMVRTQVYLTRAEHDFLQSEATRRNEPMSAVLRSIIDEKMAIPDDAWVNNPLLRPTPHDPNFEGHEDGSLNHDYYVYGGQKKYHKVDGEWVPINPAEM
ncbi:MAG: hypothetical protein ACXW3Z_05020 [Limisphaerales bacterium]